MSEAHIPDGTHKRTLRLDDETTLALQRLAAYEGRSGNAQIKILIREAAAAKGLWTPVRPALVKTGTRVGS